nr:peptidase M48 [candidate division KSB1 bacterium]NIR71599.1 peptidase M48 [candidate division KSB1 bacterium]NIS23578.1 peptidase M48 [candidate division KSB1 bacterium]NIT70504.1 peptidase M48 [candidate division KSB1 bacterium]NIU24212.1 peptidase M48 [candidate division KSB1 bacterium]
YDGNIYRFTNYSLAQKFDDYRPFFEETSYSFSELNDKDKLNREPVRLHTKKVDQSRSLSVFVDDLPMDITSEDVAILNQIESGARVEQGSWIKIPRR